MKKIYFLLLLVIASIGYSQDTVTTFLNSPDVDVDDALALDSKGNLYGSNVAGNTVFKITPSGNVSPFVTGLKNPNGIAIDRRDNVYVAEYTGSAIQKYDANGNHLKTFVVDGTPSGMISSRYSLSVIFTLIDFGNQENNSVNELLPNGTIRELYKGAPLNVPVGLTFGPGGDLYIGNFVGRDIYRLRTRKREKELKYIANVPDSGTDFPFLSFITYSRGALFATVYGEHKVFKINPRGIDDVKVYAGSENGNMDGDISEATFSYPSGIVANRSGSVLYVSEYSGLGNIRKIRRKKKEVILPIKIYMYPNPAREFVNLIIRSKSIDVIKIEMYDMFANLVYESKKLSGSKLLIKKINLKDFSPGLYEVIVLQNGDKKTKKLVIQ